LKAGYLFIERFDFPVTFTAIRQGQSISLGDVALTPYNNTHLTAHRGQPWMAGADNRGECYSLQINYQERQFVYSADIGSLNDLEFCAGCEMLLVESTHITLPELYERAASWRIGRLVLTHICPDFVRETALREAEHFPGEVIIATDGMVIPLGG
jgi:ribonuclease BN (tRNA processing enzyme)